MRTATHGRRGRFTVAALCLLGLALPPAAARDAEPLPTGAQQGLLAPSFSVETVRGHRLVLAALVEPHGALVAFVDPRSEEGKQLLGYLQASQPTLEQFEVGVAVFLRGYAVARTAEADADKWRLTLPLVHDAYDKHSNAYGVYSSASAIVVDAEGNIHARFDQTEDLRDVGPRALNALNELIEAQAEAAASEAEPATTTASGEVPQPVSDADFRRRVAGGWALVQAGRADLALTDARVLMAARPGDFRTLLWLAYVLEAAQHYREAARSYRAALELKPGHEYVRTAVMRIDPQGVYAAMDAEDERQRLAAAAAAQAPDAPAPEPAAEPTAAPADGDQATQSEGTAAVEE